MPPNLASLAGPNPPNRWTTSRMTQRTAIYLRSCAAAALLICRSWQDSLSSGLQLSYLKKCCADSLLPHSLILCVDEDSKVLEGVVQ